MFLMGGRWLGRFVVGLMWVWVGLEGCVYGCRRVRGYDMDGCANVVGVGG